MKKNQSKQANKWKIYGMLQSDKEETRKKGVFKFLGRTSSSLLRTAFTSCSERGPLSSCCTLGSLAVVSLVSEHTGLNSCGSWTLEHRPSSCGARA